MEKRQNPVIQAILGRRSIRSFQPERAEGEIREILLECAFAAPSAHNRHPCHCIVIEDREQLPASPRPTTRERCSTRLPLP